MVKGNTYRHGARKLSKLYGVNGHIFRVKWFNKVCKIFNNDKLIFFFICAVAKTITYNK